MQKRVWVLGDAVIDLLPEEEGRLLQCPGGAPANVAVGIARLGGNSAFIGCVGDDPFGTFLQQTLRAEGVDAQYMYPAADLFLTPDRLPVFQAHQGLHLCSIALSAEPSRSAALQAMQAVKQAGGWVSFDPNLRSDLWSDANEMNALLAQAFALADIIKLSEDELFTLTGCREVEPGIKQFTADYQPALLLVTRGSEGVTVWQSQRQQHYPAPHVSVVDTTGAGDAFVAGLLAALAREANPLAPQQLEKAIQQAQHSGAAATTAKGAMTALPYADELLRFTSLAG